MTDNRGIPINPGDVDQILQDGGRVSPGGSLYDRCGRPVGSTDAGGPNDKGRPNRSDSWNPLGNQDGSERNKQGRTPDDSQGGRKITPTNASKDGRKISPGTIYNDQGSRKVTPSSLGGLREDTPSGGRKISPRGSVYDGQGRKITSGSDIYDVHGRKITPSRYGQSPLMQLKVQFAQAKVRE